jgi:hypothetical protein
MKKITTYLMIAALSVSALAATICLHLLVPGCQVVRQAR